MDKRISCKKKSTGKNIPKSAGIDFKKSEKPEMLKERLSILKSKLADSKKSREEQRKGIEQAYGKVVVELFIEEETVDTREESHEEI